MRATNNCQQEDEEEAQKKLEEKYKEASDEEHAAATRIQAWWRGFIARRNLKSDADSQAAQGYRLTVVFFLNSNISINTIGRIARVKSE